MYLDERGPKKGTVDIVIIIIANSINVIWPIGISHAQLLYFLVLLSVLYDGDVGGG